MPINLSDTELSSILSEVEQELGIVLKNESTRLAKAKDGDDGDSDDKGDSSGSAPPAASDSAPPGGDSASAAPPGTPPAGPDASAPPGAADGSAPPGDGSASADPAAEQSAQDPQALTAEYSQLDDQTLEMHYVACKAALMERLQGQSASASAGSPPGSPPASPSPAASPSAPPGSPPASPSASAPPGPPPDLTQKGEMKAGKQMSEHAAANGGKGSQMKKSEEVVALEAIVAEQGQMIEGLAKATELLLTTPQRKAVTSVAYMAKTESDAAPSTQATDVMKLTKSDINAKLSEKAKDAKLSKSDRTLINQFCVGTPGVGVDKIAHLLK